MILRRARISILVPCVAVLSGCGLLLDFDQAEMAIDEGGVDGGNVDGGSVDGGRPDAGAEGGADASAPRIDATTPADGGTPPVDAGDSCSARTERLPFSRLGDGALPSELRTPCTTLSFSADGVPPTVTTASGATHRVIYLRADGSSTSRLAIDFGRRVHDVSFRFEWLSLNPPLRYDERLEIEVDGTIVVPALSAPVGTYVMGDQVRSTIGKGDGTISVDAARVLAIVLRNADIGDGVGIELHTLEYTYE